MIFDTIKEKWDKFDNIKSHLVIPFPIRKIIEIHD